MKNLLLITLITVLNFKSFGQTSNLAKDLMNMNLPDASISKQESTDYTKEVLERIQLKPAPGKDGVAHVELPDAPAPTVYSTTSVISRALEDAQSLPIGEKLTHFEKAVKKVLAASGERRHELIVRMTLNRAVDTMNTVLPIAGNNPEEVARFAANFYTEAFKLALAFSSNQVHVQSIITFDEFYQKTIFLAEYGRIFSTLMYRFSTNANLSDSAKSALLLKTLGYLGWDLMLDLRAREQSVKETLADIYSLQKEDQNVKNILGSIDAGFEPKTSDVNKVRGKVYKILEQLPQVLNQIKVN